MNAQHQAPQRAASAMQHVKEIVLNVLGFAAVMAGAAWIFLLPPIGLLWVVGWLP